ncbi:MAG: PqqD family protein [Candidatus Coatesbacteria bacterium]|nr:PqqD family protein [Candidatus Coatesbacteria bacterium]
MDSNYKPVAKTHLEKSQMGNETLLYNSENDKVTVLNKTAAAVWERCDGKHTIEQIAEDLRKAFNAPEDCDVASDVEAAIKTLREDGILE